MNQHLVLLGLNMNRLSIDRWIGSRLTDKINIHTILLSITYRYLGFFLLLLFFAWVDSSFVLNDDWETYWLPGLKWFGHTVLNFNSLDLGDFPTSMGPSGVGSNYVSEAQFGFFNLFIFVFSILSVFFNNLVLFSIIFKAFILMLIQYNFYRILYFSGVSKFHSELLSLGLATSGFILYVEISNWVQAATTMAMTLASLSFLIKKNRNQNDFLLGIFFLTQSFSVGYVYAFVPNLINAIFYFRWLKADLFKKDLKIWLAITVSLGQILATYLPGVLTAKYSWKSSIYPNNTNFFTPNVGDLVGSAMLNMQQDLTTWGGQISPNPTGYIFVGMPVLVALFSYKKFKVNSLPNQISKLYLITFFLIYLGPSDFGPFHWPGRITPWLAFSMLWVLALSMKRNFEKNKGLFFIVFLVFISFGRAASLNPSNYLAAISSLALALVFSILYYKFIKNNSNFISPILILLLIFGIMLQHTKMNFSEVRGFANYASPSSVDEFKIEDLDKALNTLQLANFSRVAEKGTPAAERFYFGKQADMLGLKFVNTGTALGHKHLAWTYCATFNGHACDEIVEQFTKLDNFYNLSLLDLFEINQISAELEFHEHLQKLLPIGEWELKNRDGWREIWIRTKTEPQDMVVNSKTNNLLVTPQKNFSMGNKSIEIKTPKDFSGATVFLNQPSFPKLSIRNQGNLGISILDKKPFNSFYSIKIPPGQQNILISWTPPYWILLSYTQLVSGLFWIFILCQLYFLHFIFRKKISYKKASFIND